ncbi:phosphatidylethanolamine-binding protein 4 isoform X2 [Phascolarctos cinereus]
MKLLKAVILMLGLTGMVAGRLSKNGDRMCVYRVLSRGDALFCKGNLHVIYPEIGDVDCMYIPECNNFRRKISIWDKPSIKYSLASENKKYILVMVDPDAPSRNYPKNRYWRHWLIANISAALPSLCSRCGLKRLRSHGGGASLKTGNIRGDELTGYQPPNPPPETGFHRYQFILFEQPKKGKQVTLSSKEKAKREGRIRVEAAAYLSWVLWKRCLPWYGLD